MILVHRGEEKPREYKLFLLVWFFSTRSGGGGGIGIVRNVGFNGFLQSHDGNRRLYSFDAYNVNCYYDLYDGLTPLPKGNIVGTEITRSFNVLLCKTPGKGYTAELLSSYYEESLEHYIEHFKDEFICMVPAETPLTVLDIEFVTVKDAYGMDSDELYHVPWLKVKTPDGVEGWFCVFYGD